jgi:hypothetical protein
MGRKAESHVCICICVSWVGVRVCVCVCARWRTGYELRQERQHGAPTRLDMCMPFFMAGVVACGNSAGLDLDASSCFGCGARARARTRGRVSRQPSVVSPYTPQVQSTSHTETHNPYASCWSWRWRWRWRSNRFIITVVHAPHAHLFSVCLCRLSKPAS